MDKNKDPKEDLIMYSSQDLKVTIAMRFLARGAAIEFSTDNPKEKMFLVVPEDKADKLKKIPEDILKGLLGLCAYFFQAILCLLDMELNQIEAKGDEIITALGELTDKILAISENLQVIKIFRISNN